MKIRSGVREFLEDENSVYILMPMLMLVVMVITLKLLISSS